MTSVTPHSASCLCGSVKATANHINPKFSVCHCQTCRSWGGAPFFAVQCGKQVSFEGQDKIKVYASSQWASRGFCSNCGTHLFCQFKESGEYNMPVGLFTGLQDIEMDTQYFSDKRPDYYQFSNKTQEVTEAQILAYFSDQMERLK